MIAAEYPKWRVIAPAEYTTLVSVDAKELAEALKRASVTVEVKSGHAFMEFADDAIRIRSSADVGSCDELVAAKVVGDPIELQFKTSYALNALAALGAPTVTVGITTDRKPFIFYPGDHIEHADAPFEVPDLTFWHMVMPVRKAASQ
jgi:DNA polymerase III sliding clamp (beta) subunit (PCNA family)